MRILLFTGKGGVGKTTAAAATAVFAAARGSKTLVLSTDPAHSLADAFGVELGAEPVEIDTGLYGQQVDTQRAFEASWRDVQHYLRDVLEQGGVDPLEAEELTVLPGAEEVLALLELRAQVASGRWDTVVVDCAPTGETLRLLALPEALRWWMQRMFPPERRVLRTLRPVLSHLAGLPFPPDAVFAAVDRLSDELAEVRDLLVDPATTSVRLVLTPESVVVAEARRTLTSLSLYGYRVDGVIANRVFPAGDDTARRLAGRVGRGPAGPAGRGRDVVPRAAGVAGRVRRGRAGRAGGPVDAWPRRPTPTAIRWRWSRRPIRWSSSGSAPTSTCCRSRSRTPSGATSSWSARATTWC